MSSTGHYIYIESSLPRRPNQIARIISPIIVGSKEKICIQYFVHMKGEGIGNLNLYWQSGTNEEQLLSTLIGEQGDGWRAQTAELELDKQFQVRLCHNNVNEIKHVHTKHAYDAIATKLECTEAVKSLIKWNA